MEGRLQVNVSFLLEPFFVTKLILPLLTPSVSLGEESLEDGESLTGVESLADGELMMDSVA